jgi:hypothetical protein
MSRHILSYAEEAIRAMQWIVATRRVYNIDTFQHILS